MGGCNGNGSFSFGDTAIRRQVPCCRTWESSRVCSCISAVHVRECSVFALTTWSGSAGAGWAQSLLRRQPIRRKSPWRPGNPISSWRVAGSRESREVSSISLDSLGYCVARRLRGRSVLMPLRGASSPALLERIAPALCGSAMIAGPVCYLSRGGRQLRAAADTASGFGGTLGAGCLYFGHRSAQHRHS